jgi:acyl-CoA thioester hydrolase
VQVQLWLDHLGTTSLVYGFSVRSDNGTVVHAEGRRVQVRLDPATLRPAPISGELRDVCRRLLAREETDAREAA